ncbi:MAG: PIG-L family deacetylase [Candidatus Eremiobacteraeota bacterium]|nr:PIG-L family deacetylase [Candidatus Eremiobacteraeota bacterium]
MAGLTASPPRTLVLLAHPDDETLGASTLLAALGPAARMVHVTDGAPRAMGDAEHAGCGTREAYAALRGEECAAALSLVGIAPAQQTTLGVVDQETWRDLAGLTRQVKAVIERERPAFLVTHPYEGGHPDHDATAFAAHAACALVQVEGGEPPVLVEQTSYHADPDPDAPDRLATASFLVAPSAECSGADLSRMDLHGADAITTVVLDDAERARKAAMFAAYASQARVLTHFSIAVERFRRAPAYDFTRPPAATIWYERLGWEITAADVCGAARDALRTLGLP